MASTKDIFEIRMENGWISLGISRILFTMDQEMTISIQDICKTSVCLVS